MKFRGGRGEILILIFLLILIPQWWSLPKLPISLDRQAANLTLFYMDAVLTEDGKLVLPRELRENAQLQPGDTLEVQLYKGSIVLRKRTPLTAEQCALLLERSRSQPKPTPEDDAAVEQAVREARSRQR